MADNDTPVASYVKLVDVDPPLAEHVLEILRQSDIAAYAEPLAGETGPYRDVRAPDRPTTRVFVDRSRTVDARAAVAAQLPALRADFHADAAARLDADDMAKATTAELDAAWDQIVSGFHSDEAPERPDSPPAGSGLSSRLVRQHTPQPVGPRDYDVHDDPDADRFVPPTPPPLPRPRDRFDTLAWAGAIGGPVVLVVSYTSGMGGWLAGFGFVAFTAGFVTLVARSGDRRDDDGNGAIV